MAISLLPDNPGAWTYHRYQDLYAIAREEREKLQLEAVRINFARMRDRIPALKKLADRQGVERIDRLEDVLPVPGMMDTAPEGALSFFEKASPFGRIGRAQEIAAVVAFLALPEASWVSGAHILANGAANT
jgi:NAD(P)-dependent dehydrogenase (short-subunit alcohol dehydrogenase family)